MRRIECRRGRAHVVLAAAILGVAVVIAAALLRDRPARDRAPPPDTERDGVLLVTSEPDGALVWVDGEERGITPLRVRGLAEGRHRVHMEKAGHTPLASGDAEFAFGGERTFHGVLSPVAPAAAFADDRPPPPVIDTPPRTAPPPPPRPLPSGAWNESVGLALEWLKNHQSPSGNWDSDGFQDQCKLNKCSGPGESVYDAGQSGLALLCFLGAGETHNSGQYKETVKNGLRYLKEIQDGEGCFGSQSGHQWMYGHLAASLAMTEAYGVTGSPLFKEPAQRAVNFVHKAQNPYLAWRYGVRDGDNDTSVTSWAVMVLKSAKMAELDVDAGAFLGAMNWIEKMTEPEFGRVGYQRRGGLPARTQETVGRFPANQVESLTAMGVLTRILAGPDLDSNNDEFIQKGVDLLAAKPPRWDDAGGPTDFVYWKFGANVMRLRGGDAATPWFAALDDALVPHQFTTEGRDERGSWDPVDPWSKQGGRVYATAMNCLSLETHIGYRRVFPDDDK